MGDLGAARTMATAAASFTRCTQYPSAFCAAVKLTPRGLPLSVLPWSMPHHAYTVPSYACIHPDMSSLPHQNATRHKRIPSDAVISPKRLPSTSVQMLGVNCAVWEGGTSNVIPHVFCSCTVFEGGTSTSKFGFIFVCRCDHRSQM